MRLSTTILKVIGPSCLSSCLWFLQPVQASIIFVDADAEGSNDGTSWINAYPDLQEALAIATAGDEIWVAEGVYKPGKPESVRTATFQLVSSVELYGGFNGTEVSRGERKPEVHIVSLSGDLNGDDLPEYQNNIDNSYHVVNGSGTNSSCVLDGFTITAGNADGPFMPDFQNRGAAIYMTNGSATIAQCNVILNSAQSGAIHSDTGSPIFMDCTIVDNAAGGMHLRTSGKPVVDGCVLVANEFSGIFSDTDGLIVKNCLFLSNGGFNLGTGGGVSNHGTSTIQRSIFISNQAGKNGGGIYNESEGFIIDDCLFIANICSSGDHIWNSGDLTIINCTIGGGGVGASGVVTGNGFLTVKNCLLWGNGDGSEHKQIDALNSDPGLLFIDYSIVQGWTGKYGGVGNNGDDPLFVDPDGADDIPGTEDDDLRLLPGSPAIDSGDNNALPADEFDLDADGDLLEPIPLDLDGLPRFINDPATRDIGVPSNEFPLLPIVDRGAYEFQVAPPACEGDANADGFVDPLDSGYVQARFGCAVGTGDAECDAADANVDGVVDPLDVGYVLSRFGECL